MSSSNVKINLTLAFVLNNATVDDQGNALQYPDPSVVQNNIVNRIKQSTYAKDFVLAWGPSTLLDPGTTNADSKGYSANVTAIFKGPSGDYRVVTSGTNPKSDFDVSDEDNKITQTALSALISSAPWDASISNGAMTGAQDILQGTAPQGGSLLDYLTDQVSKGGSVTVVGHSLGGALASVLSLYLKSELSSATVGCFTFAAPTAGNQQFANYFDSSMAGLSTRIFNSKDMVPNAWSASTIKNIQTIYDPDIDTPKKIKDDINKNYGLLQFLNYQQPSEGKQLLTGSVNTKLIKHEDTDFDRQVGYQHVDAYLALLGMAEGDVWLPPVVPQTADAY